MEQAHREMHLLSCASPSSSRFKSTNQPSLDLQLSISMNKPPPSVMRKQYSNSKEASYVEALRWQAAEQIRLAAMEKAYAERVRELTRREMELAQSEFTRARAMWERAREDLLRSDEINTTAAAAATCMEITCHSCTHKFRP